MSSFRMEEANKGKGKAIEAHYSRSSSASSVKSSASVSSSSLASFLSDFTDTERESFESLIIASTPDLNSTSKTPSLLKNRPQVEFVDGLPVPPMPRSLASRHSLVDVGASFGGTSPIPPIFTKATTAPRSNQKRRKDRVRSSGSASRDAFLQASPEVSLPNLPKIGSANMAKESYMNEPSDKNGERSGSKAGRDGFQSATPEEPPPHLPALLRQADENRRPETSYISKKKSGKKAFQPGTPEGPAPKLPSKSIAGDKHMYEAVNERKAGRDGFRPASRKVPPPHLPAIGKADKQWAEASHGSTEPAITKPARCGTSKPGKRMDAGKAEEIATKRGYQYHRKDRYHDNCRESPSIEEFDILLPPIRKSRTRDNSKAQPATHIPVKDGYMARNKPDHRTGNRYERESGVSRIPVLKKKDELKLPSIIRSDPVRSQVKLAEQAKPIRGKSEQTKAVRGKCSEQAKPIRGSKETSGKPIRGSKETSGKSQMDNNSSEKKDKFHDVIYRRPFLKAKVLPRKHNGPDRLVTVAGCTMVLPNAH